MVDLSHLYQVATGQKVRANDHNSLVTAAHQLSEGIANTPAIIYRVGDVKTAATISTHGTWLACDGKLKSQAEYAGLFDALGHVDKLAPNIIDYAGFTSLVYGNGVYVAAHGTYSRYIHTSRDAETWIRTVNNVVSTGKVAFSGTTFVLVGSNGSIVSSANAETWITRTSGTIDSLLGITYGGTLFVAVGYNGRLLTSNASGSAWTSRASGFGTSAINAVAYGNGTYVIVGNDGKIATSTNGTSWTLRTSGIATAMLGVTYGDGMFVAVGSSGVVISSPDGDVWTERAGGTTAPFRDVAYGNGVFVAVADSGVSTSPDGVTWTFHAGAQDTVSASAMAFVTHQNDMFFAGGSSRPLYSSEDGITWTTVIPYHNNSNNRPVRFAGGVFFVGMYLSHLTLSPNGIGEGVQRINADASNPNYSFNDMTYGNGTYVLGGTYGVLVTSTDTLNWTQQDAGFGAGNILSLAYGSGLFVAAGSVLTTSPDGVTWTERTCPITVRSMVYADGKFVAVGSSGKIATSTNGTSWIERTSGITNAFNEVTYGNGLFVVVSDTNKIVTSPDGVTWTLRTSVLSGNITSVAYGNGVFVAVSSAGSNMAVSVDGITWVTVTRRFSSWSPYSVAFGNGRFVCNGGTALTIVSADGINWYNQFDNYGVTLNDFARKGGRVVAVGDKGLILTSDDDGQTWTPVASADWIAVDFKAVAATSKVFVAVGTGGTVLSSKDGLVWTDVPHSLGSATLNGVIACTTTTSETVAVVGSGCIATADGPAPTSLVTRTHPHGAANYTSVAVNAKGDGTLMFATCTDNGLCATSIDGTTWTARTLGVGSVAVNDIAFNGRTFLALTASGPVAYSIDGITWALGFSPAPRQAVDVLPDNRFVIVGTEAPRAAITATGADGFEVPTQVGSVLTSLLVDDDNLIAGAVSGEIVTGIVPAYETDYVFRLPKLTGPVPAWIKAKE